MSGDFLLVHSYELLDVMEAIFLLFYFFFYSHVILISRNLICKTKSSLQEWVFPDQMRVVDIFLAASAKEVGTVLVCAFETLGTEQR